MSVALRPHHHSPIKLVCWLSFLNQNDITNNTHSHTNTHQQNMAAKKNCIDLIINDHEKLKSLHRFVAPVVAHLSRTALTLTLWANGE